MNAQSSNGQVLPHLSLEMASTCMQSFMDAVPSHVYFKDLESRFLAVSRSKAQRHGVEPDHLIGKTDADVFCGDHPSWALVDEESIISTGESVFGKLERLQWLDGSEGWAETSKMPLRDGDGTIVGTFGVSYDVTEQQQVHTNLEKTRRELMHASRIAGMAEVATGVLHNVGNVLTSLNVSANVISAGLRYSKADSLAKLAALLEDHAADLGTFITADPKGRRVPEFIESLAKHMAEERDRLLNELTALQQNIDHIKEIITMQQSYATTAGTVESLDAHAMVEDSLRMNAGALVRHCVSVVREFHPVPMIRAERAKVLQILVNLIRNAKYALDDGGGADKIMTIAIRPGAPGRVQIVIQDNGIGIAPENMPRMFQHGFTTRTGGHGFGLHSARQSATEMNGKLSVHSDGIGEGATFTLDLPVAEADSTADGRRN